jgi:hypothetical protein
MPRPFQLARTQCPRSQPVEIRRKLSTSALTGQCSGAFAGIESGSGGGTGMIAIAYQHLKVIGDVYMFGSCLTKITATSSLTFVPTH